MNIIGSGGRRQTPTETLETCENVELFDFTQYKHHTTVYQGSRGNNEINQRAREVHLLELNLRHFYLKPEIVLAQSAIINQELIQS